MTSDFSGHTEMTLPAIQTEVGGGKGPAVAGGGNEREEAGEPRVPGYVSKELIEIADRQPQGLVGSRVSGFELGTHSPGAPGASLHTLADESLDEGGSGGLHDCAFGYRSDMESEVGRNEPVALVGESAVE